MHMMWGSVKVPFELFGFTAQQQQYEEFPEGQSSFLIHISSIMARACHSVRHVFEMFTVVY